MIIWAKIFSTHVCKTTSPNLQRVEVLIQLESVGKGVTGFAPMQTQGGPDQHERLNFSIAPSDHPTGRKIPSLTVLFYYQLCWLPLSSQALLFY